MRHLRFHVVTILEVLSFWLAGSALALGVLWAIFAFIAYHVTHA